MKNKQYVPVIMVLLALCSMAFLYGCGSNATGGGAGGSALSATIYVSNTGSDDAGDGSSGNPYQTIQHAMNVCASHDVIGIYNGLYKENVTWTTRESVTLIGESRDGAILSGEATDRCIYIDPTSATDQTITMESLTITNGYKSSVDGGGIYIDPNNIVLHLKNVSMTYNRVDTTSNYYGGAINGRITDSIVAENCDFSSNEAFMAGAIYLAASGALDTNILIAKNCRFFSNSAVLAGGAIYVPYVSLEACAFYDNAVYRPSDYADSGAAFIRDGGLIVNSIFYNNKVTGDNTDVIGGGAIRFYADATLEVVNCTIVSNEAIGALSEGGGIVFQPKPTYLHIKNCIIRGNIAASVPDIPTTVDVTYSDIQDGHAGTGNVSAEPGFAGTIPYDSVDDFKLTSSTTTDVTQGGTTEGAPSADYSGAARTGYNSMGAFQY